MMSAILSLFALVIILNDPQLIVHRFIQNYERNIHRQYPRIRDFSQYPRWLYSDRSIRMIRSTESLLRAGNSFIVDIERFLTEFRPYLELS